MNLTEYLKTRDEVKKLLEVERSIIDSKDKVPLSLVKYIDKLSKDLLDFEEKFLDINN